MRQSKTATRFLWLITIFCGVVFALSSLGLKYKKIGGEPYFPLYHFVHDYSDALQLAAFLSAAIGSSTLLTLIILAIVNRQKPKPFQEFNQRLKFNRIRKLSLFVAAIPGFVLTPLFLALGLYAIGFHDQLAGLILNPLTMVTFASLMPGAIIMVTLVVFAVITAFRKPTDPTTPAPKPHRIQIALAVVTSAMPVIAFVAIFLTAFDECIQNCFIFSSPVVQTAGAIYLALWITQGIIWLSNRAKKITA